MGVVFVVGFAWGWGTNLLLSFSSLPFPISFPFFFFFLLLCTVAPQCFFDTVLPTNLGRWRLTMTRR